MTRLPVKFRRLLLGGAFASVIGVFSVTASASPLYPPLTLIGLGALALGIHWVGRAGPDS